MLLIAFVKFYSSSFQRSLDDMPFFDQDSSDSEDNKPPRPGKGKAVPLQRKNDPAPPAKTAAPSILPSPTTNVQNDASPLALPEDEGMTFEVLSAEEKMKVKQGSRWLKAAARSSSSVGPRWVDSMSNAVDQRKASLEAIAIQKLQRERKEEQNDAELSAKDLEMGQFQTPQYRKRVAELRTKHKSLFDGEDQPLNDETEVDYYDRLNNFSAGVSQPGLDDSRTIQPSAIAPTAPNVKLEETSERELTPASDEEQRSNSVESPATAVKNLDELRLDRQRAKQLKRLPESFVEGARQEYRRSKTAQVVAMSRWLESSCKF